MKTIPSLQSILAGVGAGSLLVYVLACATSFSPDDRQVIYPAFDPQSGATSVALYDRKTKRTETLLTSTLCATATNRDSVILRAEWLPDGKHILVGQAVEKNGLLLTVLARDGKEPAKNFIVTELDQALVALECPFAVVGSRLFLNGDKADPLRIDLITGEMAGGQSNQNPVLVMPAPGGKALVGLHSIKSEKITEFGTFDPETLQFKPLSSVAEDGGDGTLPYFNPADGRAAWIAQKDGQAKLETFKAGKTEFTRALVLPDGKLEVGPLLDFAPDGKTVFAAACVVSETGTNSAYGLLEIPLSDAPLRFTPLFHANHGDDGDLIFAQPSLSHDGKTWAIATSYLYRQNQSLRAEDCALFLVDLGKSSRPVTKVPVPVPPLREKLIR